MQQTNRAQGPSELPRLELLELEVSGFRNLANARIPLATPVIVLSGENGQGKTSVLEAIYCVATTKSFRTAKLREAVSHGQTSFRIKGRFQISGTSPIPYEQQITLSGKSITARIDGNKPKALAEYARRSPVVIFHPDELQLSAGPAALRRRLLDRIALHQSPGALEALARYRAAIRGRSELLRRRAQSADLEPYEDVAARTGAQITVSRRHATETLFPEVAHAFAAIADPALALRLAYDPGGTEDPAEARVRLAERRERDARLGAASFGPHRDDVHVDLGGHEARKVASQGQHRAIALALKIAEGRTVRSATGHEPVFLLDDISSELDRERTRALLTFLSEMRAQTLLSTTRPELIMQALSHREIAHFRIVAGSIEAAGRA